MVAIGVATAAVGAYSLCGDACIVLLVLLLDDVGWQAVGHAPV
jgi:hypothetical protein